MKVRTGFVANSSSQHSITFSNKFTINDLLKPHVIDNDKFKYVFRYDLVNDGFGWEYISHYRVQIKLNYIMLELMYKYNNITKILQSNEYNKLKNVIREYCEIEFELYYDEINVHNIDEIKNCNGYIDHQSIGTIYENEIFENNNLEHFLFDINSTVNTGNNNNY